MRTNGYLERPASTFATTVLSPNIPSVSDGWLSPTAISYEKGGRPMQSTTVESTETIEAVRYLWAMVGMSAGVIELLDRESGPAGERLTCRNRNTKSVFTVSRGRSWTEDEEKVYAAELDRALGSDDEAEGDLVAELVSVTQRDDRVLASVR